jgi:mono/diheme cytochrome c family protein
VTRAFAAALSLLLAAFACGCQDAERNAPFDFERMIDQPRYDAYGSSAFFEDRRAMREPPELTIPVEASPVARLAGPRPAPDRELLATGRERFIILCSACHGRTGLADTPVAERMTLRPPPSLHEPRLRAADPAYIHRVIVQGYGLMPSYATLASQPDAWGIAYYVKALQLSVATPIDELPPRLRERAERELEARERAPRELEAPAEAAPR